MTYRSGDPTYSRKHPHSQHLQHAHSHIKGKGFEHGVVQIKGHGVSDCLHHQKKHTSIFNGNSAFIFDFLVQGWLCRIFSVEGLAALLCTLWNIFPTVSSLCGLQSAICVCDLLTFICMPFHQGWLAVCCLMTLGLRRDIRCHVLPSFDKFTNQHIRHQATQSWLSVWWWVCIWSLQSSSGVCVGMYGLTYSLYHLHQGP